MKILGYKTHPDFEQMEVEVNQAKFLCKNAAPYNQKNTVSVTYYISLHLNLRDGHVIVSGCMILSTVSSYIFIWMALT